MLTANRVHQFLTSAREWDTLLRKQLPTERSVTHRLAVNDDSAILEVDLPGHLPDELDVEIDGQQLTISPRAKVQESDENSSPHFRVMERLNVPAVYQFQFPFLFDHERTEVTYSDGVLTVSIKKPESELPRKLEVK